MSERETLTDMLFRILNEVKDAEDVILVLKNGEEVQPYTNEMPYEVAAQMLAAASHSLLNTDYGDEEEDEDE